MVNLAGLFGRLARTGRLAAAKVVEVRAQQDVFGGGHLAARRRKTSNHVAVILAEAFDSSSDFHPHFWNHKAAFGMRVLRIERGLERFQIPAAAGKKRVDDARADGGRDDV